jgi:DNA invertase Pin-like site-specific DNA recombinase
MSDLVAYLRVSTDRQASDGAGLDVQEDAIRRWARTNRHRIVAVYGDEGESGALLERDGWADVDSAIRDKESAGVVVYKLDRLARDLLVQEQPMCEVWRLGGEVYSTAADENKLRNDPEDPTRKLVRRIMGVIGEYEREMIVLRMRRGRRHKAKQGGFAYGSPPYGYAARASRLVPLRSEQAVIRRIRTLRGEGVTTAEIAAGRAAAR